MTLQDLEIMDKKTALFDSHLSLNAKMVPFGGFKMPVSYLNGIQSEYFSVRKNVGIFDVSHMGEFKIFGCNALEFLQKTTTNDVSKLQVGQAQYSAMCFENGRVIDDLILYCTSYGYLMVVNASNIKKDFHWLCEHICSDVQIENVSDEISLIAIQGPKSRELLINHVDVNLMMPFYTFEEGKVCGFPSMVSRTGYTGELGFEIYGNSQAIKFIWKTLINEGADPAGLAARDILRMEMAYCLYGNDINENTSLLEAGLGWITSLEKDEFIGKNSLKREKAIGSKRHLVAFKMEERGIPRSGYEVYLENKEVGFVTSGNQSPLLNGGIGLAYVDSPFHKLGQKIKIKIRTKLLEAIIIKPPFLQKTSLHN